MAKNNGSKSHAEQSNIAESQLGLLGKIQRPIKITMLGAGSTFTLRLCNDILSIPGLNKIQFALVDIDKNRLSIMYRLIQNLINKFDNKIANVIASTERRKVLKYSDYIINSIEVSGLECVRWDNNIPAKYNIDQCIGDTIGPGGIFKGLRTIPVWLDILKDVEDLAPAAIVLNYTNPMNMLCLAAGRKSSLEVVGLCHSVQGTSHILAKRAGVPYADMEWECGGINHLAWFTKLHYRGKDLYPILKKKAGQDLAGKPSDLTDAGDLVRKEMMIHFGAFITESSGHLSEYIPYYRKRKDLIKKYCRAGYDGQSSFYAKEWPKWRDKADKERYEMLEGKKNIQWERSWEYASWIIEAIEKDIPIRIYGNVMNKKDNAGPLISNLMADGCVEIACMVDRNKIRAIRFGQLAPQMAALCDVNMRVFDLGTQAAIEKSKELAIYAMLLDPLCAAVCSVSEIRQMTLELFDAEKNYLKGYK